MENRSLVYLPPWHSDGVLHVAANALQLSYGSVKKPNLS